jgi:hypothetical protein
MPLALAPASRFPGSGADPRGLVPAKLGSRHDFPAALVSRDVREVH